MRHTPSPGSLDFTTGREKIESSAETLLLLKTAVDQLPSLEARLHELHSYQTPEFLVLEIEDGSHSYLEWLRANLGSARGTKV